VARFLPFFGRTVSEGAAFAVGAATAPTLHPLIRDLENQANQEHPSRVLDAGTAAAIVAEDVAQHPWGENEAEQSGVSNDRFDKLLGEALNAPGLASLYDAWRRDLISDASFEHGLRKAKLEPRWDAALKALKHERLEPNQIALGIVRSLIADPGFLPVSLDTAGGTVPAYDVSGIDAVTEAEAAGIDRERLRVMVGEIGRPMALDAAAQSTFRGIIRDADFNRAVLEGDTRPEWAEAILEHAKQIPAVSDYINARIRGWITDEEMNDGVARHGMSPEDAHLLYLRTGRPAAPGQMATAAARGIAGPDGRPMDETQFLKGIAESDIRPEWGKMLWESRYLYPPLFQLTRLVQAGAIDADTARDWAVKDRYPPEVVNALHKYWLTLGGTTESTYIGKAETHLWTTTHTSYKTGEIDEATARENLAVVGVPVADRDDVMRLWTQEALTIRKQLTITDLKRIYKKPVLNLATGNLWTRDEVLTAVVNRGYSLHDATSLIETWNA
jgi:hypothetical protein